MNILLKRKNNLFPLLLVATILAGGCSRPAPRAAESAVGPLYSEQHLELAKWKRGTQCCQATGTEVAVASAGSHSSRAGSEIYKAGGNVVDAAVATAFSLAVERPQSLGLGGGGFLTLHLAGPQGGDYFVDFRETAPGKATRDMYLDKQGKVISGLSSDGALSVGTPGFVAGMQQIHKKWGKLPWKKVLAPSIRLARDGFPVYLSLQEAIAERAERFGKDAYLKRIFFSKEGRPLAKDETLVQQDLANTLETLAREGGAAFYTGPIAKKIVSFVKAHNGILDAKDLRGYRVKFREPIRGKYKDLTYVSAPPPSAGGAILTEVLNVLAPFDLAEEAKSPVGYAHLLAEAMKHSYADRSELIGDPDFVKTGYEVMLSAARADEIRKQINREAALPSSQIRPARYVPRNTHGTAHLSVMDNKGNAVASTLTINTSFGSKLAVPGTGVFLNNEMDDFSVKPGEKNAYGLTGGDANAIAPNKRPVSSMMPTIVMRAGQPVLVVGAAGGSRIISSVTQVILNDVAVFPNDLRKSMFAPRVHHQWLPDRLDLEGGFSDEAKARFKKLGHETAPWPWSANVQAVQKDADGKLTAVFDPRDEGGASAQ